MVVVCEWSWAMAVVFGWWQLFSRLLVVVGGAMVVMCERSWAVVAVFVWWQSLVIVLGSCSRFWVVVFDRGPLACDDLGLVPWKSTRRSMEFQFFFTESGRTLYGITRHNNINTIPIIFHADSAGMSNSMINLAEFRDSSRIPGGIPGGE